MTWQEFQLESKSRFNITIDQQVIDKLALYEELLLDYNMRVNLTAHRTPDANREKNFLDSLAISLTFPQISGMNEFLANNPQSSVLRPQSSVISPNRPISLLDIGTGAGFPGMILAIIYPNLRVTLMDSIAKKTTFLHLVKEKLDLKNVTVITAHAGRTVASGNEKHHEQPETRRAFEPLVTATYEQKRYDRMYDIVVARAVSTLTTLLPLMQPYVRRGGALIAMKGGNLPEEIKTYEATIGPIGRYNIQPYSLPSDTTPRSLFIMRNE